MPSTLKVDYQVKNHNVGARTGTSSKLTQLTQGVQDLTPGLTGGRPEQSSLTPILKRTGIFLDLKMRYFWWCLASKVPQKNEDGEVSHHVSKLAANLFCSNNVETRWPHGYCARLWIGRPGFEPWPGTLCCVLWQETSLSQCLSSLRCINIMLGVTLRWNSIASMED